MASTLHCHLDVRHGAEANNRSFLSHQRDGAETDSHSFHWHIQPLSFYRRSYR